MPKYSIDEIIRQAMEDGKFDDLPGKGKPLNLEQNPHQDPEWRLAHHMLKSSGFTLPWIEWLGEINEELGQARSSLAIAWDWQQNDHGDVLEHEEWQASIELFEDRVQTINKKIRAYNLEVPNPGFQVVLVDTDQELAQVMNNEGF